MIGGAAVLVVAKAPVPGRVKTRLAASIGHRAAARLAAAALVDTLRECAAHFGPRRRVLALDGELEDAVWGGWIGRLLDGWAVVRQRGDGFGERLYAAHQDAAGLTGAPVVQIGMDTPQVRGTDLARFAVRLQTGRPEAMLGPAWDGGWWALGVSEPALARCLVEVEMSRPATGRHTQRALRASGARVHTGRTLRDVDHVQDARVVAALAPHTVFAREWRRCETGPDPRRHRVPDGAPA